jgi:NAD(P)-dependent dehydrogenase (short-subunit alcohol dehydrogenase family)
MKLSKRIAIVTGAAQGIGQSYALALAKEGARVAVVDVLNDDTTVNLINEAGGEAVFLHTDVSDEKSVMKMVDGVMAAYGRIDILINNAALFVSLYPMRDFETIDYERWDRVMKVNVGGTFLCCKHVVPVMRKQQYGRIINISSSVHWRGLPGFLDYSSSKGAIIGMTRAMAHEVGKDQITVNSLAPGYTQSEGVIRVQDEGKGQDPFSVCAAQALARPQVPEDLTGALIFLASDDSAFISGQTLVVDGGLALN